MGYSYDDDTYRKRINDASRIIPAAPDARLCHVWQSGDANGVPQFEVTWHRILAWSVPIERGEAPIPLTADGWGGEPYNGFELIEDHGRLILQRYGPFDTPQDVMDAARSGEIQTESMAARANP